MTVTSSARHAETAARHERSMLGFWIYLMTDCMLFAALFATYAVLRQSTNGGPDGPELFKLPFVLIETLLLLTSSYTCGLALLSLRNGQRNQVFRLLVLTGLLGAVFVGMEAYEFHVLATEGNSWQRSGFLSAYFTLVATHGIHITVGLIWLLTLLGQLWRRGTTAATTIRLRLFSIFWHFLDVIWIFIFSVVYLWSGRL